MIAKYASLVLMLSMLAACAAGGPSKRTKDAERIQRLSQTYTKKGAIYLSEGKLKIALHDLHKAIDLDPENAEAYGTLGVLYERLGKLDEAERYYARARKLAPENPTILNNYGRHLCAQGKFQEGLKVLQRAAADPLYETRWIPLTNAGECALKAGDLAKAEAFLRQALTLNGNFPPALAAMAELSFRKGKYLSARAFIERYKAQARLTEAMLRLAVKVETALGDSQAARAYQEQLQSFSP